MAEAAPTPDNTSDPPPSGGLLATKLSARGRRGNLVARPRLNKLLDEGLLASLTLVSAPAGFGKTTLLAEWLRTQPHASGWLSLDAADNDPARFLSYVIAALHQPMPGVGGHLVAQLRSPKPPSVESAVTSLINEVASAPYSLVLVLDDYHVITSTTVNAALTLLLDNAPPNLHLVISTRSDPPIPLARLRSRGQVVEIRTDDLRFTRDEAAAFLGQTMGLALLPAQVASLDERAEGWIAGLQMAALSVRGRTDVDGFIRAFAGTNRFIMDFMLEEVLAREPKEVQAFLLSTSVLSRLSGPLCDAVTGATGSQEVLESLERRNLFVFSLDDERRWYRYHQLFSDLLNARLLQTQPELVPALHLSAADWYVGHGLPSEAVRHALDGQDYRRAAALVEQLAMSSMVSDGIGAFISWLEALPREYLHGRPWLYVYRAWSLVLGCQTHGVDDLLQRAEQALQGTSGLSDAANLQGNIAMIRAYLALFAGDLEAVAERVALADALLPANEPVIRCDVKWVLGFLPFYCGDLDSAVAAWEETRRHSLDMGNAYIAAAAMRYMARAECARGRLESAIGLYKEALGLAAARGWQHSRLAGAVKQDLADVYRERSQLSDALTLAREAVEECARYGSPSNQALSHSVLARVLRALGEWNGSLPALDQAMELCRSYATYPWVRSRIEAYQVQCWLADGDLGSALRWTEELHLRPDDVLSFRLELAHLSLARVHLAQGKAAEAAALLARLNSAASAGGRTGSLIEILVLQALALRACHDPSGALLCLSQALALAEPEGYVRVFVDEGPAMLELLRMLPARSPRTSKPGGYSAQYLARLRAAFGGPGDEASQRRTIPSGGQAIPAGRTPSSGPLALVEPLSERERHVLRLMAEGLTNQQIAATLIIALGTVKAHVHNISGKLGSQNRAHAVARAQELDLL